MWRICRAIGRADCDDVAQPPLNSQILHGVAARIAIGKLGDRALFVEHAIGVIIAARVVGIAGTGIVDPVRAAMT